MPVIREKKQSACCCGGNILEPTSQSCCEALPTEGPPVLYQTDSNMTATHYWDHILARWGWRRSKHRVQPGLYVIGKPNDHSPVFVSANYTLSFDALRCALGGVDGYILVLDTRGVNVWCAAGKGTFGTQELIKRIEATRLKDVVSHRKLILPQLGAPGVAAHEVKKRSGFSVEYGPVRAADLPEYLKTHQATMEMRRVRFTLWDRLVLVPIEMLAVLLPALMASVVLLLLAGPLAAGAALASVLAGVALFPILLPWLPFRQFSAKGFILGGVVALPFALVALVSSEGGWDWRNVGWALAFLLGMPPVTAFLSLNFTGATTFTSKTGVEREMFTFIPAMAWTFGAGLFLVLGLSIARFLS